MPDDQQPRLWAARRAGFYTLDRHGLGDVPQVRDVGGIVLAVAVERRNPASARRLDAAADRGALVIAARMPDQTHKRQSGLQPTDLGDSRIAAAVIDTDDLVSGDPVKCGSDFSGKRGDVAGLVFDRD